MKYRNLLLGLVCLACVFSPQWVIGQSTEVLTERPTAMKLFPYETIAFIRVANCREVYQSFQETAGGKMFSDPELAPFLADTWAFAGEQFNENLSEESGVTWDDLSRLPKGEVAVGLVNREGTSPGVLLLADFDGEQADADFLLENLDNRWAAEAMVVEETDVEGDTLYVVRAGDNRENSFGYLVKDACLVGSNDETLLRHVLDRWAGRPPLIATEDESNDENESDTAAESALPLPGERTLAENESFVSILRECSTQLEESPQTILFADPIALVEAFAGRSAGGRIAIATFPSLGLDGILGVGGTASLRTSKWDSLAQFHLLLGNPRSGILTLLRFKQGDITPPNYVPANAYGYNTLYADAPGIYERLQQLIDQYRYEGSVQDNIARASEEVTFDIEEVVINNFAGRLTLITSFDEPRRFQGEQRALGATLVDPQLVADALEKLVEKYPDRVTPEEFGGVSYYATIPRPFRDMPPEERPFSPCLCLLEDTLLWSQSTNVLHQMIEAHQDSRSRLADSIEFKVIKSRVERLTRGRELALFYYENAGEVMRHWYEIAQLDSTREGLGNMAENFGAAQGFLDVLEANDLPPFETFEKYLAPTGGYMIDTNTGLHLMLFDLRRDLDP